MRFIIEITTDNAAFVDNENIGTELAACLDRVKHQVTCWPVPALQNEPTSIRDTNGNKVGYWVLRP